MSLRLKLGTLAFVALLFGGGCESREGGIKAGVAIPDRLIVLALDVSDSTKELRDEMKAAAFEVVDSLGSGDRIVVLKFGRGINELHDGRIDEPDAFSYKIRRAIESTDPEGGTDYSQLSLEMLSYSKTAPEARVLLLVLGDGANDFRFDEAMSMRYREAADAIAGDGRIEALRFWGLGNQPTKMHPNGGPQKEIREVFADLGPRLQLRATDQSVIE